MPDYSSIIAELDRQTSPAASNVQAAGPSTASPAVTAPTGQAPGDAPADDIFAGGAPAQAPSTAAAPAPSAPGADPGNPYAGIISDVDGARTMAGQLALYGARGANPDTAAQAAALQPQIGGASTVIEQNLPAYQAQAKLLQNQQTLQSNPALADWMASNSLAPRVSSDDLHNLSAVSSYSKQWGQGWSDAVSSNALARLYAQGAAANPQQVASLEASMQAGAGTSASGGVIHFLAGIAGGLADSIAHAAPVAAGGAATGAAVGAVAAGTPTLGALLPVGATAGAAVGGGAGFESGMFLDGYRTNAGTVMHALDGVKDANGNGIDPSAKAVAGFVAGVVGGSLNLVGLGAAGRIVGDGISSLLSDGFAQAVARPGVGAALARAAVNIGKGGLTGAGLGALTESTNVLSEQAARMASSDQFATILSDPQQRQDAVDSIAESAATMALQMGVLHGVGALPPLIAENLRARRASDDLSALNGMMQTAQDSTTQTRAPSMFENWVQSQTAGGRGERLFVPGDAVQELYQSKGITPGPDDGLFGQFMPDIREQMEQARLTGGDIVAPTAGFVAHMSGTAEAAQLMPHIRIGEDGMSQTDVDAYTAAHSDALQARGNDMQQEFDAQQAGRSGVQAVHDDVLSQARAAGLAPDTAEQYAALMASRYATRGERLGEDPLELYREEGIQLRGPEQQAPLKGKTPDNLDMLINAVRSDRPEASDGALFGPSLMSFLARRGGVEDPGGDLKAIGAGDWHKGKPGTRRFIRPARDDAGSGLPGMGGRASDNRFSPDAATLAAHEAGYLPGTDRPDINTLHDAVRREMSGDPVYTEQSASRAAEYRDAVRDLSDALDRKGIDPKTASNEEIRAALGDGDRETETQPEVSEALNTSATEGDGTTFEQTTGVPDADVSAQAGVWRDVVPGEVFKPGVHVRMNVDTGRNEVFQPANDVLRGSIRLSDGSAVISLFAKRDLSTFLHESGHLFLDEMSRDAALPRAPEQIRGDMAAVREWLGAKDGAALTTEQHEQFARGFEAYLMEGTAPSLALRGAFRRFRAWLVGIYRSVAGLRVELTPAIRDVMDRLLASDDEIARARDDQRLGGLFQSAEEAGMTDAEFGAYTASVERARSQAVDSLTTKTMSDVRRERQAWWRHQEEPIRDEVQAEVDARPEMRALELFRSGRMAGADGQPGKRITLDRSELIDTYGSPAVLDMLPKRVPPIYGESGLPADVVASMVGMRSGDALVKALLAHESLRQELRSNGDNRSVRAYSIDTAVHDRMVERHGEVLTDGSLEGEAMDRVHSERQLDVLAAELRALGRRTKTEATPLQVAKQWADRSIAAKTIKDGARPNLYARAEAKAGRAAERALLAGDLAAAFRAKQQQLLNHALYISAKAAKDDVDAGMRRMERFGSKAEFPTIQSDFVDRVHELLRRFGMALRRNSDELDRGLAGVSLQSWATERLAEGNEIFIAPDLYDPTYARHADELSISQFRDLADTVKSIAHAGRGLEQVTVDGEKQERAAVVEQMVGTMSGLRQRDAADFVNQGGATGAKGIGERAVRGVSGFHAMLLKPETIIDTLDSRDPNGIFNRAVFRPIKAAQGMENDLLREVTGQLKALHESLGKGYGKDFDRQLPEQPGIVDPRTGAPMALKRRGLIGIALNVGNESNLQRLVDGYGWTHEAVQTLLDRHMTEADWRFVQGSWDTFESLFPRVEAMQRRLTGVGLDKIEPHDVQTPHGTFRGGYYPVMYDPNLSTMGDRIKAQGDQRFEGDYVRATTQKGHTVSRVQQVKEPLSLDPDNMAWKLRQSVHDLAYREAIISADRLLRNRDVISGMDSTIGRDQRKQLDRWLQGVANDQNQDTRGLAAMDSFLHRLRTNAMVVGIGFRASTMLKHGSTALSNSIGELGPKWMLQGSREFFGSPDKMRRQYEFITSVSAEMRNRSGEIDRDVRDALRDAMGKSGVVPAIARFSHYGVATLDMASALPTWLGAFRKAQAEGMEQTDAVAYADKTVRNAHGANGAPDLSAIQRGSEAQKLMTMFYGFFNHIYNRQVVGVQSAISGVRNLKAGQFGAARGDFAHSLSTWFFYLVMPALIEATVAEGLPTDPDGEGWLSWAAKAIGGAIPAGVPVLRDVANSAIHGRSYTMSPTGQAFDTFVALGKDIGSEVGLRDKPVSDRWVKHAITAPGYVFGLPTGQAAGTAQFLADVASGQEDPQSVADWMRGLTFGPPAKHAAKR